MKHIPSEKYSIAWFKLSECVSRGEKERALGVYKLLSYSIDDPAFLVQLKADLLLAFGDDMAIKKYLEAAWMYKKEQRFIEAAALYEHLLVLQPDVDDHIVHLIALYELLSFQKKIEEHLQVAVERFADNHNQKRLNAFLKKLKELSPISYKRAYALLEHQS